MAQIGRFIDGPYYGSQDFAEFFTNFLSTGFFMGLEVEATDTMNVIVSSGSAFIEGYEYRNTDDLTLTVSTAEPTTDRIDRIVVRLDRTPDASEHITAIIRRGSEEPPDLVRNASVYEISLAQIVVEAGKSFIEEYQIIDERGDVEVCGRVGMSSAVEDQIDSVDIRRPDDPPSAHGERSSWFHMSGRDQPDIFEEWLNSVGVNASDYGRSTDQLRANVETVATKLNFAVQTITIFDWARARDYQVYGVFKRAANSIEDGIWGRWHEEVLVFESGQNSNGEFIRYTNGVQECWFTSPQATAADSTTSVGLYWGDREFNFPASFSEIPTISPSSRRVNGVQWSGVAEASESVCRLYIITIGPDYSGHIGYVAEGRWR